MVEDSKSLVLSRQVEVICLLLILGMAGLMRVDGLFSYFTPQLWFANGTTIRVDDLFTSGTFWSHLFTLLHNFQVDVVGESFVMFPIAAAFQAVLGASFELPQILGTFWGTLVVLLAWWIGREYCGPRVGLIFAALVACSPLQITWSKLGGIQVGGAFQVLFVIGLTFFAGKRGSIVFAVLAGWATWSTLYMYHGARVALPLGVVFLLAGLFRSECLRKRKLAIIITYAATFIVFFLLLAGAKFAGVFWPQFSGYPGNLGERSVVEFVTRHTLTVIKGSWDGLFLYFLGGRTFPFHAFGSFPKSGGLTFLPMFLVGIVGLIFALQSWRQFWPWLLLLVAGLAVPALSSATARRLLVFDLGWCALCALAVEWGIISLLKIFRSSSPRSERPQGVQFVVMLLTLTLLYGGASTYIIEKLNARLPADRSSVAFADGYIGDGLACLHCRAFGRELVKELEQRNGVIVMDSGFERESTTAPGSIPGFSKIASIVAQRRHGLLLWYSAMYNRTYNAPFFPDLSTLYNEELYSFFAYVSTWLVRRGGKELVWYFERPTAWERWFSDSLVRLGGERDLVPNTVSADGAIRVRFAREDFDALRNWILKFDQAPSDRGLSCLEVSRVNGVGGPELWHPDLLTSDTTDSNESPKWFSLSADKLSLDGESLGAANGVVGISKTSSQELTTIRFDGRQQTFDLSNRAYGQQTVYPPLAGKLSENSYQCHWYGDDRWWTLDALNGSITADPLIVDLPEGQWVGFAVKENLLVLTGADQRLVVFDTDKNEKIKEFRARILPTGRRHLRECVPVIAGDDFIGVYTAYLGVIDLYSFDGTHLGRIDLTRLLGVTVQELHTVSASGRWIGVAFRNQIETLEIVPRAEGCLTISSAEEDQLYSSLRSRRRLGELFSVFFSQGWGEPMQGRDVFGNALVINGKRFEQGIGVHAASVLRFELKKPYTTLTISYGTPDTVEDTSPSTTIYSIWGDGKELWHSDIIFPTSDPETTTVDLNGIKTLELRVDDAGDNPYFDAAAWVNPILTPNENLTP